MPQKPRGLVRFAGGLIKKERPVAKTGGAEPKGALVRMRRLLTWANIKKVFMYGGLGLLTFVILLFAWFAKDLPNPNKINSRLVAQASQIFDREGNLLYEIHGDKNRTLISFEDMPQYIKDATVVAEDDQFYKHHGFDLSGIIRAFFYNLTHEDKKQGGSTITQQFVKNALLSPERTFSRKIKELILSVEIELIFSKEDILKMYLNEIPYGTNAYGVQAAAQTYFGKDAKDMNLEESATLAALAKAPTFYSPFGNHPDALEIRKNWVLDRMGELGYATPEQVSAAKSAELKFVKRREDIKSPHFVFYVREILAEKYGEKMVEEGGLKITTTLDPKKQALAEEAIQQNVGNIHKYGASNAALASSDPKTGQILAMVGSIDYWDMENDGNVNVATAERQPGSSFKPYAYATAFSKNFGPGSALFDLETDFGGGYKPKNYTGKAQGPVSMRKALAGSLNISAVKTLYLAGIKETIDTAHKMGITTLNNSPDNYGLALVLGGGEIKLVDHVSAFGVFANEGKKKPATSILKIEDGRGKVLEEYKDGGEEQVIDPQVAWLISDILSDNSARAYIFGSRNDLTLSDHKVAAKTGTTQEFRDAWTVGYTPSISAGVWVGNNDNTQMKIGADGSEVAAPIWNYYMKKALEGTPNEDFPKPGEVKKQTVGKLTGGKPIQGEETNTDWFPSWFKPEKASSSAREVEVCKVSNKLKGPLCPQDAIEKKTTGSINCELPKEDPSYKRWQAPVAAWAGGHGYGSDISGDTCDVHTEANRPSISINSPSNGDTVASPFTVKASVSAPLGVSKVNIYLDGAPKTATKSGSFYQASITASAGNHDIYARVFDNGFWDAQSSTISVNVSGSGDITPPTITMNAYDGATLSASATDAESGIDKVEFYGDGHYIGEDSTPSGDTYSIGYGADAYGNYWAKAYDNAGNSQESNHVALGNRRLVFLENVFRRLKFALI